MAGKERTLNLSSLSKLQYLNFLSIGVFFVALFVEIMTIGLDSIRVLNLVNFAIAWAIFVRSLILSNATNLQH